MVGERHVAQEVPVVVHVERRPAAVSRLHVEQPVDRAARGRRRWPLDRIAWRAAGASSTMAVSSMSG